MSSGICDWAYVFNSEGSASYSPRFARKLVKGSLCVSPDGGPHVHFAGLLRAFRGFVARYDWL